MTLDEMRRVMKIVGTADGACPSCVGSMTKLMRLEFPEFSFELGGVVYEPVPDHLRDDDYYDDDAINFIDVKVSAGTVAPLRSEALGKLMDEIVPLDWGNGKGER